MPNRNSIRIPRTLYFRGSPLSVAKEDSPAETKSFKIQHSTHNMLQPPSLQRFRSLLFLQRLLGVGHQRALNPNSAGQHTEFGPDKANWVTRKLKLSSKVACLLIAFFESVAAFSLLLQIQDILFLLCVILSWCCKATETASLHAKRAWAVEILLSQNTTRQMSTA